MWRADMDVVLDMNIDSDSEEDSESSRTREIELVEIGKGGTNESPERSESPTVSAFSNSPISRSNTEKGQSKTLRSRQSSNPVKKAAEIVESFNRNLEHEEQLLK